MERRDFLKLASIFLGAMVLPKGTDMASFSELIGRMASGRTLNAIEQGQLRNETRAIEEVMNLTKGWVTGGTSTPIFQSPMESIYSKVLSVDTASLTVAIPNKYKHLLVMGSGRVTGSGSSSQFLLAQFNSDTGTNYSQQKHEAFGSTSQAVEALSQVGAIIGMALEGAWTPAADSASFFAIIPHYLSSYYKNVLAFITRASLVETVGTKWANDDPIKSITFLPITDSFAAGFIFSVYGIL